MRMFDSLPGSAKRAAAALLPVLLLATPVLAADAAPVPDKGDTAWMMVSTLLVLLMILPGLQHRLRGVKPLDHNLIQFFQGQ